MHEFVLFRLVYLRSIYRHVVPVDTLLRLIIVQDNEFPAYFLISKELPDVIALHYVIVNGNTVDEVFSQCIGNYSWIHSFSNGQFAIKQSDTLDFRSIAIESLPYTDIIANVILIEPVKHVDIQIESSNTASLTTCFIHLIDITFIDQEDCAIGIVVIHLGTYLNKPFNKHQQHELPVQPHPYYLIRIIYERIRVLHVTADTIDTVLEY